MSDTWPVRDSDCSVKMHEREGACYNCCPKCDFVEHRCGGCGVQLMHNGRVLSDKDEDDAWHKKHCV